MEIHKSYLSQAGIEKCARVAFLAARSAVSSQPSSKPFLSEASTLEESTMQCAANFWCRSASLSCSHSRAAPVRASSCFSSAPSPLPTASLRVNSAMAALPAASSPALAVKDIGNVDEPATRLAFLAQQAKLEEELTIVVANVANACKHIAALLASPSNLPVPSKAVQSVSVGRDDPKPLDIVSAFSASL